MLFTGPAEAGKAFLARKLEALLVAETRHAYLLEGENLKHGLDADLGDSAERASAEVVRRYGEVARLLVDTGLIVVSTTNAFGATDQQAVQAIRTLVYPAPVISVYMSTVREEAPPDSDLVFTGPENFDAAARQVIEELKRRGILAHAIGDQPVFQYSI